MSHHFINSIHYCKLALVGFDHIMSMFNDLVGTAVFPVQLVVIDLLANWVDARLG